MQHRRGTLVEHPLSPRDYDVPVGWWGWNWEPPIPMSIIELLEARNMDARTVALCGMVLNAHGSMLIAAEQPHSGKTTTLTAFLDFLPNRVRRIFLRGWVETFDYLKQTRPDQTLLLGNELSSNGSPTFSKVLANENCATFPRSAPRWPSTVERAFHSRCEEIRPDDPTEHDRRPARHRLPAEDRQGGASRQPHRRARREEADLRRHRRLRRDRHPADRKCRPQRAGHHPAGRARSSEDTDRAPAHRAPGCGGPGDRRLRD